jgi:hypothetical protein
VYLLRGDLSGNAETGDRRNVQGARTQAALLSSAVQLGFEWSVSFDEESTHTLRPAELVGRERRQIGLSRVDVNGDVAEDLYRVAVHEYIFIGGPHGSCNGGDVLDGSDLVVDGHHRNQDRVRTNGAGDRFRIDQTIGADGNLRYLEPLLFERASSIEYGMVLEGRDHNVVAVPPELLGGPLDGQVVRLGPPAGEDHFSRTGSNSRGDLLPGVLHYLASPPPVGVHGGGVAEVALEDREHRLSHLRQHRSRRGIVQIGHRFRIEAPT